jgi:phosphohistidine phosphatase
MQLLFLRHGPAEPKSEWSGDDEDRPLTAEGRHVIHEVACSLQQQGLRPGVILTSPLARARQTADIVADCLAAPEMVRADKRLAPGFGMKHLEKLLRDHDDTEIVMFVGHDPDISELVRELTGARRLAVRKGGLAQIELPDRKDLKGRLISLLVPTPANPPPPGSDPEI